MISILLFLLSSFIIFISFYLGFIIGINISGKFSLKEEETVFKNESRPIISFGKKEKEKKLTPEEEKKEKDYEEGLFNIMNYPTDGSVPANEED